MSVKESVFLALNQEKGNYLSGEKLSESLGVSRAAVWKAINSLREEGYRIDAVTNRGYRLSENGEAFTAADIRDQLPTRYKGNGIFVYEVTDSTNLRARQIAEGQMHQSDGASDAEENETSGQKFSALPGRIHGSVVAARQQTAGRGRLGRSFFSPSQGVYISIIIKPHFDMSKSTLVTVAAAAAVAEAVDFVCGQSEETEIKWVNDIYLKGKKICGILSEGITDFESGQIESMIVGIGINTTVDDFPEELRRTAGAVEGDWSRAGLIAEIMTRFLDYAEELESRSFLKTYQDKSLLTGKEVLVYRGTYRRDPRNEIEGIPAKVTGISDDGGLKVRWEDGRRETLTTGEVTVRTV